MEGYIISFFPAYIYHPSTFTCWQFNLLAANSCLILKWHINVVCAHAGELLYGYISGFSALN